VPEKIRLTRSEVKGAMVLAGIVSALVLLSWLYH
jgi:hypothetical protein